MVDGKEISAAIQRSKGSNAKMIVYGRAATLDLGPAGFLAEEYVDEPLELVRRA